MTLVVGGKPYEYRELRLWFNKIHEASFLFGPDVVKYLTRLDGMGMVSVCTEKIDGIEYRQAWWVKCDPRPVGNGVIPYDIRNPIQLNSGA